MKPSAEALDVLQGDKNACLGYLLPTVCAVKNRVLNSMLNTQHGEKMRDALLKSIMERFEDMMEIDERNMFLYIASASHPLFKLEWLHECDLETVKKWFCDAVKEKQLLQESILQVKMRKTIFFTDTLSQPPPRLKMLKLKVTYPIPQNV